MGFLYASDMDTRPLFVVYCESELNAVGLAQYVRAETPETAMTFARSPGVRPIKAERFDETQDWTLDAINRTQRGIAAVHDGLRAARFAPIIHSPFWTIFWAVVAALLFWLILGMLLGVVWQLGASHR